MGKRASKKPRRRARKKLDLSYFGDTCTTIYDCPVAVRFPGETFPLSAGKIGKSATAIIRLYDRKLLTRSERNRAWKRLTDEALK